MNRRTASRRRVALDNLDDVLDQLVDMAAESFNLGRYNRKNPIRVDFHADRNVISVADKFEKAVERALDEWVTKNPYALHEEFDSMDLYDEDGPYNVLMTLNGHGVGIWDGRWDHFFVDDKSIKSLERHLDKKLSKFAEGSGTGLLNEAIMDAAFEQDTEERGHHVDEDMDPEDYMSEPKTASSKKLRQYRSRKAYGDVFDGLADINWNKYVMISPAEGDERKIYVDVAIDERRLKRDLGYDGDFEFDIVL